MFTQLTSLCSFYQHRTQPDQMWQPWCPHAAEPQIWTSSYYRSAKLHHCAEEKWNLEFQCWISYSNEPNIIVLLLLDFCNEASWHRLNHLNLSNVTNFDDYFKIGQQWFCGITASRHHQGPFPASRSTCYYTSSEVHRPAIVPHSTELTCYFCSFTEDKKMWNTTISNLCSQCAICPQMNWDIVATRHENDGKWGWEKENVCWDRSACCDISPFNLFAASLEGVCTSFYAQPHSCLTLIPFTSQTFNLLQVHKVELIETYEGIPCVAQEPKRITFY